MSDERDIGRKTAAEADVDPEVRAVYREVAGESAPERLDRAVLSGARAAARPRISRVTAMLKPVAWAATIGLSLAIVLELTVFNELPDLPEPAGEPAERPAAPARSGEAEEAAREAATPEDAGQPTATAPVQRDRDTSPISMDAIGDSGTMMLKQAEERARQQVKSGDAAAFRDEARVDGAADGPRGCDAAATRDPADWLACIEDLERRGELVLAEAERRRFEEAWPDYEPP